MSASEELKVVNDKIDRLNEKILTAKKILKKNPQDTDAEIEVEEFQVQLADLKEQRERWFKVVEAVEMKKGILIYVCMQFLQKLIPPPLQN
jgi:lipid II:glycine glycyltransferase (peptidoglycan interpeptide bridge formation enzyme)